MTDSSQTSVFVGNIPYDVTEEDIANVFRQFGDVNRVRLVTDPATGKGKGYGFVDFVKPESAEAAKRMSMAVSISGRSLRVDNANANQGNVISGSKNANAGHSLKQARDLDTALAQLTIGEVYDVLVEVKAWVKKDPDAVRELLAQRPVLAQALLKMQEKMGMLQTAPSADASFDTLNTQTPSHPTIQPNIAPILPQYGAPPQLGMPGMMGGPVPQGQPYGSGYFAPPPLPGIPYGAPPPLGMPQYPMPGLQPQQNQFDPQQAWFHRIMGMSAEEVSSIPDPQERAHVMSVRSQYGR